jgi:acyl-CoA thioester hydrolase
MTRPGFAFSTRFKVRYAEIDGQKVVFNSRYLEYADVAVTEFWDWTGIGTVLGAAWHETEFHVRKAEVEYLRPFTYGDTIAAFVRIEQLRAVPCGDRRTAHDHHDGERQRASAERPPGAARP